MKKILTLLFILVVLFFSINTQAYEVDIEIGNTYGEIEYTTSITGSSSNIKSTLPLNSSLLQVNFNQYIFKDWADYYSVTLGSNLFNKSTKKAEIINFTDNINNKQSKLTGETSLENFYLDFLLANYLLEYSTPKQSYLILIGYEYDNYVHSVENGNFYDYSNNTQTNTNGNVVNQKTKYHIPYLGLILNRNINKSFKNRLIFKFSPYAFTDTSTKNYYEDYTLESTEDGSYLLLKNKTRYNFKENIYITGSLQYKRLDTNGTGERYFYDGSNQGLTQDFQANTFTEEYNLNIGIEYLF
ncbi:MAG: omptin family outer membrane protease [Halanaerobiales bacterium]|nr:omptin family outer membrane protease [Halanaerobiales bacterium]